MAADFKGVPIGATVPGDRHHTFVLPRDRSSVPAKTLAAIEDVQQAVKAAGEARGRKAEQEANDAVRDAVGRLYDKAASTSRADREHHREGYSYAAARYQRAMGEAENALQLLADHARQADNPTGIGFRQDHRDNSPGVLQLRLIADQLANLPAVPALD